MILNYKMSYENYIFSAPQVVCSQINETNELSGNKSLRLDTILTSTKDSISPVLIEDSSDKNSYYVIMPMKI